jgi:hypothetical protein
VTSGQTVWSGVVAAGGLASAGGPQRPRRDTIAALPPGDYFVIAVDDVEAESVRDPEFLEQLFHQASRVTLSEDAQMEMSLGRVSLAPTASR